MNCSAKKIIHLATERLKRRVGLLILGVAVCALGQDTSYPSQLKVTTQQNAAGAKVTFRPIKGANGKTKGGSRFSVQVYESSNGVTISSRLDRFSSARSARKELNRIVRTANLVERAPKLGGTGQSVEERVIVRSTTNKAQTWFAVLWTDRNELHRIQSSSLSHVLEFEKQFYP